jgi:hypothetical protein
LTLHDRHSPSMRSMFPSPPVAMAGGVCAFLTRDAAFAILVAVTAQTDRLPPHRRPRRVEIPPSAPSRRHLFDSISIKDPARAANASGFVQTALSGVTRRPCLVARPHAWRRVTPDRVLSFVVSRCWTTLSAKLPVVLLRSQGDQWINSCGATRWYHARYHGYGGNYYGNSAIREPVHRRHTVEERRDVPRQPICRP